MDLDIIAQARAMIDEDNRALVGRTWWDTPQGGTSDRNTLRTTALRDNRAALVAALEAANAKLARVRALCDAEVNASGSGHDFRIAYVRTRDVYAALAELSVP